MPVAGGGRAGLVDRRGPARGARRLPGDDAAVAGRRARRYAARGGHRRCAGGRAAVTDATERTPGAWRERRHARYRDYLAACRERAASGPPALVVEGRLHRSIGLAMEAEGCHAAVGGRCDVVAEDGRHVETEV